MFNLSRQAWIGIGTFFALVLAVAAFLFFDFGNNPKDKDEKPNSIAIKGYDVTLEENIRTVLTEKNRGELHEGFSFQGSYLTSSRSLTVPYDDTFSADILSWVKKEGTSYTIEPIGTSHVHSIYKEKGTPFFQIKDKTFVFFGEKTDGTKNGKPLKGYVYEIDKKGNMKLSYETKGVFDTIKRNKENEIVLIEKEYRDDVGMYETNKKPYILYEVKYQDGNWKQIKLKEVTKPN